MDVQPVREITSVQENDKYRIPGEGLSLGWRGWGGDTQDASTLPVTLYFLKESDAKMLYCWQSDKGGQWNK